MSKVMVVAFKTAEDADKVDLSRIGIVSGGSSDGTKVSVEPDFESWDASTDGVDGAVVLGIVRASFAACGVWPASVEYGEDITDE